MNLKSKVLLLLSLVTACGGLGNSASREARLEKPIVPSSERPEEGNWHLRYRRRYTEWGPRQGIAVTARALIGGDGSVFDRTSGRVTEPRGNPDAMSVLSVHQNRLVQKRYGGALEGLEEGSTRFITDPPGDRLFARFSPDGQAVLVEVDSDPPSWALLSFETGKVILKSDPPRDNPHACARGLGVGFSADGALQCVLKRNGRYVIRTDGRGDAPISFSDSSIASWSPRGGRILIEDEDKISWIDDSGDELAHRALQKGERVMDVGWNEDLLVETARGVERWWVKGSRFYSELVSREPAPKGRIRDNVVMLDFADHFLWLERRSSEFPVATKAELDAPDGYAQLRREGDEWHGEDGVWHRARPTEAAAFYRHPSTLLRVYYSDTDEFADRDLTDWADAIAVRYLEPGDERWVKAWFDGSGRRHMRGHAYLGGCVRAHYDLYVVERSEGNTAFLEHWELASGGSTSTGLPEIPSDAVVIDRAAEDERIVDPSVGI